MYVECTYVGASSGIAFKIEIFYSGLVIFYTQLNFKIYFRIM